MATGVNWPDLRRDYDILYVRWQSHIFYQEWIDLIWEGITTCGTSGLTYCLVNLEWIDLIWEGITTLVLVDSFAMMPRRVNWPDLRRDYDINSFVMFHLSFNAWVNWPDLRRDYDFFSHTSHPPGDQRVNWPDLRRDYDSFALWISSEATSSLSELTWFEKGLRLFTKRLFIFPFEFLSELTWFEKGLRPSPTKTSISTLGAIEWIDLIWEGITTWASGGDPQEGHPGVNWPDLRRDYDLTRAPLLP